MAPNTTLPAFALPAVPFAVAPAAEGLAGNLRDADTVEITRVIRAQEAKHKTPCDNAFLAGSDQHGPNHIPLGYLLETGVHITLYHHALPRSCCSRASSQA